MTSPERVWEGTTGTGKVQPVYTRFEAHQVMYIDTQLSA
ncbi:unnamed protein product [Rhodiola kirilowii]